METAFSSLEEEAMNWFLAGQRDREIGNEIPGWTNEDFYREYEPDQAKLFCEAYMNGFRGFNA